MRQVPTCDLRLQTKLGYHRSPLFLGVQPSKSCIAYLLSCTISGMDVEHLLPASRGTKHEINIVYSLYVLQYNMEFLQ